VVPAIASNNDYWTAFGAGADDVMRVNGPKDEILGRANAPARIRSWALPAPPLGARLAKYPLWEKLEQIVGAELGEMLTTQMSIGSYAAGETLAAAELPLTLPDEQIHIRIGFGVDAGSLAILQQTLLGGDTSIEGAADALREMANVAGGAIKRAALKQGIELTIGLPTSRNVMGDPGERRAWNLDGLSGISAGMRVACVAIASASQPKMVVTKDLREGMVIARDVRNQMGMLIVPAGTNLTRTTVEQLGRLLDATATLEVTDVAA